MSKQNLFPAVILWAHEYDPCHRLGMGRYHAARADSSGSIQLHFRLIEGDEFASFRNEADAMRDMALSVYFDNGKYKSARFVGHDIFYADEARLSQIVKFMRKWNKKADQLYPGREETLEELIRRMIAATGAKTAISPEQKLGSVKVNFISLDDAMAKHIMPAVEHVRGMIAPKAA